MSDLAKLRRDARLLDQSYRAVGRASEWLRDLDTSIDGRALDLIGELLHEIEAAECSVDALLERAS